jgi:ABC-2 type transport system ATP-binding protein
MSTHPERDGIKLDNISKTYKGFKKAPFTAVENMTLSIGGSQVFGVLGANGAGKTTTIKMICGLIIPTTGTIHLNGYDVKHQRSQAATQIGAVLEGTRNVYWRLTAWQNLLYFGALKGCSGRSLKDRSQRLLQELDLWDRRNEPLRFFSRGMQQKVAVACALISDPPIVLLDEPTLGLDIQAAITVKNWIANLAQEEGKTVILTTHQLDLAQDLCENVAIMYKGKILANQPLHELLYLFERNRYQLKIRGILTLRQEDYFSEWTKTTENDETLLEGVLNSQEELHTLLTKLHDWDLPILAVSQQEPDLENVFVRVIEQEKEERNALPNLVNYR